MSRERRGIFALRLPRGRIARLACVLFLFCVVNAAWAVIGTWTISFGSVDYDYFDKGSRHSGIYSRRGYLVISVRDSLMMYSGMRPPDWRTRQPKRQPKRTVFPWSLSAGMHISPEMFAGVSRWYCGILDARTRYAKLGLIITWEDDTRGEWYNRGIAIHWVTLTATTAVIAIVSTLPCRSAARRGRCAICGYDLRATPDRCPECGTVPPPEPAS